MKEPEDKWNIVYYLFFLFGIGKVLPFNAIVTAIDYFDQSFPTRDVSFSFNLMLNGPNFLFNFVNIFTARIISLRIRLLTSIALIFVMVWLLPITTNFMDESTGWIILIFIIVILGISNSFLHAGVFGLAGMFPFKYTGAVMFGNGISGISMNVSRMATLAAFPPKEIEEEGVDPKAFIGCIVYFAIASAILAFCFVGYFVMAKTEFAKFYMNQKCAKAKISIKPNHTENYDQLITHEIEESSQDNQMESKGFLRVYKDIWSMGTQVFLCFAITFVVFPGTHLSTHFDFLGDSLADKAWFSVIMITIYNLFDTIGRFAGGFVQILTSETLFYLTITRLVFIPTSVLVQLNSRPSWIFQSDWFRILNMALFAVTNGYNSTLCMMYGPSQTDKNSKERAGIIMSFHLLGGVFVGALISTFVMVYV
ncbi:unnamed protein product [Moneuplotes crassus]|uniref:Uncharacterized protein n=1 Tax=Euplotes crassus TaxID=5936 RepID=A0AAD1X8F9_EUPCR|nr:unnamed protein product [Moneuplotes crassus]